MRFCFPLKETQRRFISFSKGKQLLHSSKLFLRQAYQALYLGTEGTYIPICFQKSLKQLLEKWHTNIINSLSTSYIPEGRTLVFCISSGTVG